jgi:hypothetical protein
MSGRQFVPTYTAGVCVKINFGPVGLRAGRVALGDRERRHSCICQVCRTVLGGTGRSGHGASDRPGTLPAVVIRPAPSRNRPVWSLAAAWRSTCSFGPPPWLRRRCGTRRPEVSDVGAPWVLGRRRPRSTDGTRRHAAAPSTGTNYRSLDWRALVGQAGTKRQRTLTRKSTVSGQAVASRCSAAEPGQVLDRRSGAVKRLVRGGP